MMRLYPGLLVYMGYEHIGGAFDVWLHYKSYYTNTETQY